MLSSALISGIILKTFCEFEGFDLAKDDIKEKALRDTKRNEIFYSPILSTISPRFVRIFCAKFHFETGRETPVNIKSEKVADRNTKRK